MVNLYVTLIKKKRKAFDQIPNNFKSLVEEELKKQGYDTNGDKIVQVV